MSPVHLTSSLHVHISDMTSLSKKTNKKHPDGVAEFKSGNLVVHKTSSKFSDMALD